MKSLKLLVFGCFVFLGAMLLYIIPDGVIIERDLFPIIIITLGSICIIIGIIIDN